MNLQLLQLNKENMPEILDKKIVCVQWFPEYLDEIYEEYPEFPDLYAVIEIGSKYADRRSYRNKSLIQYRMDSIEKIPKDSVLVVTSAFYEDIFKSLSENAKADNLYEKVFYYVNRDTRFYKHYLDKYSDDPLEDIIIFRSGPPNKQYVKGLDYGDNARALFEYMLANGYQNKYKLAWFVKDPEQYKDIESQHENIHFFPYSASVSSDEKVRDAYYNYLCHAKYIFFTEAYAFCRYNRDGQTRVQLWHGCGYKGSTVKNHLVEPQYEYMPVISKLYAKLHAQYFGLKPSQMLVTGYPKEDWLFHPYASWRDKLSVPHRKKTIFWLPTFRTTVSQRAGLKEPAIDNETGISLLDGVESALELNSLLNELDIQLVIKLHPLQEEKDIKLPYMSNISLLNHDMLVNNRIEINQILGDADALISDYSSAATDYLVLNRPLAFAMDDEESFRQRRGFLFENLHDWLPGKILHNLQDMERFIEEISEGIDSSAEKRSKLRFLLNEYDDDNGSKRLLETLGIEK